MQPDKPNETNKELICETNLEDMPKPELKGHIWIQQGTQMICKSCPFTHSTFIEHDQYLAGYKDGMPIIKRR